MGKMRLPEIGFGTWRLTGSEAQNAVRGAIGCGYRLIDTAASYGNETAVKKALNTCEVPREELVISGKLWNTKRQYDDAIAACRQSLRRLGLEYFDLYLVHWPASPVLYENWREVNAECWRAMETLQRDGFARMIGVCNYLPRHLDALMETAEIVPTVNQIELHPGFLNRDSLEYCLKNDIQVEAWSPLGEGTLLNHPLIQHIAQTHQRTPAQICLRWCVQHGAIPIPKSANEERIRQNLDIFSFALSEEEMEEIDAMPFSGGPGFDPDTITIYG